MLDASSSSCLPWNSSVLFVVLVAALHIEISVIWSHLLDLVKEMQIRDKGSLQSVLSTRICSKELWRRWISRALCQRNQCLNMVITFLVVLAATEWESIIQVLMGAFGFQLLCVKVHEFHILCLMQTCSLMWSQQQSQSWNYMTWELVQVLVSEGGMNSTPFVQ
jgi:hypothetical protein